MDRKSASVEGYNYSAALKGSGITWDEANLHEWLKNLKAKVAGTEMAFAGYPDDKKISDVIAYLKTHQEQVFGIAERVGFAGFR